MPTLPRTAAPTGEETEYVRRALQEVRAGNAITVAWLRVLARAFILVNYGAALLGLGTAGIPASGAVDPTTALSISAVHLTVGLLVLWWLHRRPSERVIALGAASDFLTVALGAWLAVSRGGQAALAAPLFMAVWQLLLLWAVLTLRRQYLIPLAAGAVAFQAALVWRAGLNPADGVAIVTLLAIFAFAVSVAGSRLVTLAVRASLEARAGDLSRRHAQELRAAKEALELARAETETLTALIVHDLRNPLASILASVEVARAEVAAPTPVFTESVEVALAEVHRLAGMAGDLLLVSRIEDGLEPVRAGVPVKALLDEVARSFGPVVARTGATLQVRGEEAGVAELDEGLVRRLIENLLVNASRHVGEGDRIELAAEPAGDRVRLAVRNSGPPVPAEARPHLFEKGNTHGRREWHHAGLGLHLCALVARRHGGTIALVDRPGWGVSFEAELDRRAPVGS